QRVAGRGYHSCNGRAVAPVVPVAVPPAAAVPAAPGAGVAWPGGRVAASAPGAAPAASAAAVALISSRRVRLMRSRTPCSSLDGLRRAGLHRRAATCSPARAAHGDGLAAVAHRRVGRRLQRPRIGTRAVDPAHPDLALLLHARPAAFALADHQLATGLVPRQRDAGRLATLVAVV